MFWHWQQPTSRFLTIFPLPSTPLHSIVTVVHGIQHVAKFNEAAANEIGVHVACLRLPAHTTDVVLSFNSPLLVQEGSSSAKAMTEDAAAELTDSAVAELFTGVLGSFQIHDYGLFA